MMNSKFGRFLVYFTILIILLFSLQYCAFARLSEGNEDNGSGAAQTTPVSGNIGSVASPAGQSEGIASESGIPGGSQEENSGGIKGFIAKVLSALGLGGLASLILGGAGGGGATAPGGMTGGDNMGGGSVPTGNMPAANQSTGNPSADNNAGGPTGQVGTDNPKEDPRMKKTIAALKKNGYNDIANALEKANITYNMAAFGMVKGFATVGGSDISLNPELKSYDQLKFAGVVIHEAMHNLGKGDLEAYGNADNIANTISKDF